jgi:uncharacterized damage-inducible protein DinB
VTVTDGERAELIARYRAGHRALLAALEGLSAAELDWRPSGGAWSVRAVVHHLADAELTGAVRLRRLLTEDAPLLPAFDEEVYRRRLAYAERPIEPALDAVRAAHATTAELLDRLAPADWARSGTHSEEGPYSLERWLRFHAAHTHEHAAQVRQLRLARVGRAASPPAPSGHPASPTTAGAACR